MKEINKSIIMRKLLAILLRIIGTILWIPMVVVGFTLGIIATICEVIYYGEIVETTYSVFINPNYLFKLAKKIENE